MFICRWTLIRCELLAAYPARSVLADGQSDVRDVMFGVVRGKWPGR
jgi:hypothetical protein